MTPQLQTSTSGPAYNLHKIVKEKVIRPKELGFRPQNTVYRREHLASNHNILLHLYFLSFFMELSTLSHAHYLIILYSLYNTLNSYFPEITSGAA
jgi:hypothetical protein